MRWDGGQRPAAEGEVAFRQPLRQLGSSGRPTEAPASPSFADEVAFISGIDANGRIAALSYWSAYEHVSAFKFGDPTAGTGATITYAYDAASGFTATEQATFERALATWSAIADVQFVKSATPGSAAILLHRGDDGLAYTSGAIAAGSDTILGHRTQQATISIDTSVAGFDLSGSFVTSGGYGFATAMHEIGHAIGLGHSGAYDFEADPRTDQFSAYDTTAYSVMSYFDWTTPNLRYGTSPNGWNFDWGTDPQGYYRTSSQTPMQADIIAIQGLYGPSRQTPFTTAQVFGFHSTIGGTLGAIYDFSRNATPVLTLTSSALGNTLDVSGFTDGQVVRLTPGASSNVGGLRANVIIAEGTWIDKTVGGSGWDMIYGNDHANRIDGGSGGQDVLYGGAGDDMLIAGQGAALYGELGDDRYYLIDGNVYEDSGNGFDRVFCSGNGCILNGAVEVLTFTSAVDVFGYAASYTPATIYGNAGNDELRGGSAGDKLVGNAGGDTLWGGWGTDQLFGGDGDDVLLGEWDDDELSGGDGADSLDGDLGNDVLNGGAGGDHLEGGAGDDRYVVDAAGDVVFERRAGGHDLVTASISYTLPVEVEDLQLTGAAARGTGNASANVITGSAGVNALAGLDGNDMLMGLAGRDQLDGGAGNDVLTGGVGIDLLTGGIGADRFVFRMGDSGPKLATMDRITDFSQAQHDLVDLSALAAGASLTFVGNHAFSGIAGEVRYALAGALTNVTVDLNGDKVADFGFHMTGQLTLVAADFVLHA